MAVGNASLQLMSLCHCVHVIPDGKGLRVVSDNSWVSCFPAEEYFQEVQVEQSEAGETDIYSYENVTIVPAQIN